MNEREDQSELHLLLADLAESNFDEAQWQRVKQLLASDGEARQSYVRTLMVESLLERFQVELDSRATSPPPEAVPASKRSQERVRFARTRRLLRQAYAELSRPTPLSLSIAAVVVGVLITAMAFMAAPIYSRIAGRAPAMPEYVEPVIVATLTGVDEPVWADGQIGQQLGSHLVAGREMNLKSGLAEITFRKGSRVVLEGPAKFVLQSENAGWLTSGKLIASVPPSAVGFEVETPAGVIVDLGTEFGLHVRDEHVEAHVFVGEVLVQAAAPRENNPGAWRLKAGEALRLEAGGASSAKLDASREEFNNRTQFVNIARGKKVIVASGSWPHHPYSVDARYLPDHVVDGRIDDKIPSYWLGCDKTPNEFLIIDLDDGYQLERIELVQTHNGAANDRATKDFELWAASKISGAFELVDPVLIAKGTLPDAAGTGAQLPVHVVSAADGNLADVKARYLHFVAKTHYGNGAGLNEIRVFGQKGQQEAEIKQKQ